MATRKVNKEVNSRDSNKVSRDNNRVLRGDSKDSKGKKASRGNQGNRDNKDSKGNKDNRDNRDSKGNKASRGTHKMVVTAEVIVNSIQNYASVCAMPRVSEVNTAATAEVN